MCLFLIYLFFLREATAATEAAPSIAIAATIEESPVLGESVLLFVVVVVFLVVVVVFFVVVGVVVVEVAVVVVVVVFVISSPS